MKDPKVNGARVVFGPCRLSYCHLMKKHSFDGDPENGKYSTNILIPKSEKKTIKAINEAIKAATDQALATKWGGKMPKNIESPLKDGDDRDDELYAGHYYLNAKAKTKPGIIDMQCQPITDEDEVYSGMWANVSVSFFGFDMKINKGLACGLNNVQKFKDDEFLGGRSSAESDFQSFNDDPDEDDL